ncbi:D-alanyl-D-alanine carboxypeptidase [Facklamia sp. DSM 111018]|uniref:D-alanyl-D-alanine carboxypeptidase n=2 Tax=Facklamia lactis TaxID=2749967 RepID=A0ABS0LSY2_9LACT|nr:D-alanyl-D-alanine carboxypeptidase [Facklamia lactis]
MKILISSVLILLILAICYKGVRAQVNSFNDPSSIYPEEAEDEGNKNIPETLLAGMPVLEKAKGAFIIDGENGQILYSHLSDQEVEVAAVSKLLTIYLVYQALDQNKIELSQEVWISDRVYEMSQDYDIPNVPLRQDIPYKIEDLLQAATVSSANSATLALAELVGGTEKNFVKIMRDQLDKWQIESYNIVNATGLSSQYDPNDKDSNLAGEFNRLNAEAVATIAYHLSVDYPQFIENSSIAKMLFQEGSSDEFEINNPNKMISEADSKYAYDIIDGMVLGSSPKDGYSSVISAKRGNFRTIVVILGVDEESAIYQKNKHLVDYSFNAYRVETVIKKNNSASQVDAILVENGTKDHVDLEYKRDLNLVVPIIDTAPRLTYTFDPNEDVKESGYISAPVSSGIEVGKVQVNIADYTLPVIPSGSGNAVTVMTGEDIEVATKVNQMWHAVQENIGKFWDSTRRYFTDLFN